MPYVLLFVAVFLFYIVAVEGFKRVVERFEFGYGEYLIGVFIAGMLFWLVLRWVLGSAMRTAIFQDWKAVAVLLSAVIAAAFCRM